MQLLNTILFKVDTSKVSSTTMFVDNHICACTPEFFCDSLYMIKCTELEWFELVVEVETSAEDCIGFSLVRLKTCLSCHGAICVHSVTGHIAKQPLSLTLSLLGIILSRY